MLHHIGGKRNNETKKAPPTTKVSRAFFERGSGGISRRDRLGPY